MRTYRDEDEQLVFCKRSTDEAGSCRSRERRGRVQVSVRKKTGKKYNPSSHLVLRQLSPSYAVTFFSASLASISLTVLSKLSHLTLRILPLKKYPSLPNLLWVIRSGEGLPGSTARRKESVEEVGKSERGGMDARKARIASFFPVVEGKSRPTRSVQKKVSR